MFTDKIHRLSAPKPPPTAKLYSDDLKPGGSKKPWWRWLFTKPIDLIATPLYIVCNLSLIYYREPANVPQPKVVWWEALLIVISTIGLLAIDRYEDWVIGEDVTRQTAISLFLGRFVLVQLITQFNPNEVTYFLYLILPFSALLYFGQRIGFATGLAMCWLVAGRLFLFPDPTFLIFRPVLYLGVFSASTLLTLTTAVALLHEKTSRTRTEQLLMALQQSQDQLEELATTTERNRLARDIHDSLGHYLTVINIQLSKAQAYWEKDQTTSEQAVDNAKRLANEALDDVRKSVKSLRTGQELFSLQKSLPLLVANLQSDRLTVELEMNGSETGVSKQYLMILYRVAQEGLTNIQRHSASSWARVSLEFTPELVQLTIEDKGKGFSLQEHALNAPAGYGLFGLRERLESIGGQFTLDSQPGAGTRLNATIIINDEAYR